MRKIVILASVIGSGLALCGFAENGMWLPAIGCIAYNFFVLWANTRRKPRAATQGKEMNRPIYSYSNIRGGWRQDVNERWRA